MLVEAADGVAAALTKPYWPTLPFHVHQLVAVLPLPAKGVIAWPLRIEVWSSPVRAMRSWLRA